LASRDGVVRRPARGNGARDPVPRPRSAARADPKPRGPRMSELRNGGRKNVLERPVIRDTFRKELRAKLMSEAVVVLAPHPRVSLFAQPWLRPAFAFAAVLVLVVAGAAGAES